MDYLFNALAYNNNIIKFDLMAYIEWDYTVITSMVENQGWNLPDQNSKEWKKFNDELGEKMRGVGIVFEKYCQFTPDIGEGVHLLDE